MGVFSVAWSGKTAVTPWAAKKPTGSLMNCRIASVAPAMQSGSGDEAYEHDYCGRWSSMKQAVINLLVEGLL